MDLKEYLEEQIKKNKFNWKSKSEIIRCSGNKISGHTNKIVKQYEKKFNFGSETEIKDKEIKKYFKKQIKNSFISVEGAVREIQLLLPKDIIIGETIIYNRLKNPKFNTNNLRPQTLDNQVSKFAAYNVKITKEFIDKVDSLKEEGIYLTIEETIRGSHSLRLKTNEHYGNLDKSFPPNNESIISIKQLIRELKGK